MSSHGLWRKPWLWLPPKVAHDLAPFFLYSRTFVFKAVTLRWRPFSWRGLEFANRLGIAGGVDKDGSSLPGWWSLGVGFVEVGTVTPRPQGPNPGRIIARDATRSALWNKMGFPSRGMDQVANNLRKIRRPYHTPVFINIGKNRDTRNESAASDYVTCLQNLYEFADAFVINISSPNTSGLRELLKPENLKGFLAPIIEARNKLATTTGKKPLLLKLSPDLEQSDLENAIEVSLALNIDGWIVSNTTLSREQGMDFPKEGGVSGGPLAPLAKDILRRTMMIIGPRKEDRLLISAGGVMSPQDVKDRLDLGADLVQVYSALIFEGPRFFKRTSIFFNNLI
jgi:dihydroorotate dehydrogenase